VRDLSDEEMLSIMIHENATVYGHGTATNNHAVGQAAKYIARELLKAEALGGWQWICAGHLSRRNIAKELFDGQQSYRRAIDDIAAGALPGHQVVSRFLAEHGNPLSEREVRAALAALKGTDLEREVLAEAREWAANEAEKVRAEQRRLEEAARQAAEEAERKRLEAERRAAEAAERRRQAEARAAEEAERRA
jgi:hypothetical protein